MTNERKAYRKLCTEFYDMSKPIACPKEIEFYEDALRGSKGPILEAMCGSGRLLLPLLKRGLKIDGLDYSSEMLESCKERCLEENLEVELFHQAIDKLPLRQYGLIYIAIGSFQLITDRAEALKILQTLHSRLLPGGKLILDMFIPWDSIKACIEGEGLSREMPTISSDRNVTCPDKTQIFLNSRTTTDAREQLEISKNRYEKHARGKLVAYEEEELSVRWYFPYEMQLFLEKAGFSKIHMTNQSFEHNPHAVIFSCSK